MFPVLTVAFLGLVLTALALYYFAQKRNPRKLPGPIGYPIIGNLLQMKHGAPFETWTEWNNKYGPIYEMRLGSCRAVVLGDPELIKEAFNDTSFSGRPNNETMLLFSGGRFGILATQGPDWVLQRRFTGRHLKDFAFGKRDMEILIMEEVRELLTSFKTTEGQAISPNRKFSLAILNALWMIIAGTRYSHDDPTLNNILEELFGAITKVFENGAHLFIPELSRFFPKLSGWNQIEETIQSSRSLFSKLVATHKESWIEGSPRDLIDTYLDEIQRTIDPTSSFHPDVGYEHLKAVLFDMFAAGSETTANTLTWTILYLIAFPEVQVKFQEEIDRVIGQTRFPTLADRPRLPYAEALLFEVLRFSPTVVMGMFHTTTTDVSFHGYSIPEGTYVLSNIHRVHRDPKIWGDPAVFRPERFLTPDGSALLPMKNCPGFLGFSTGKRSCLGEALAKDEFFLFATSIFQRFNVRSTVDPKELSLDHQISFMNIPKVFQVVMEDRLG